MELNPIPSVQLFLAVCNVVSIVEQQVIHGPHSAQMFMLLCSLCSEQLTQ